ncbi:sigma factor [Aquibacillus rhizosphaerae]|uniref:RNA polymerase sigma factor SigI n=1 Tax=Aquibacillus rhizosphaerae TaxID=3051431 RepID=A0ABT7L5W4_9BACI|nr:sigma factor [Aquibacillus sp. LR5S19]MDL4840590.1 sigma factor [Aquibacillus sp. LR5S19]
MKETEVTTYILSAANGDEIAREKLINHYKPYIINTVGHICKRYITWSDEESSIGLLAFNRAIETYDVNANKTFLNYVYLLIKRELIDYFRREQNNAHIPIEVDATDNQLTTNVYDIEKSMNSYKESVQREELIEEILELKNTLLLFHIEFEELEKFCPKHRKTKMNLLKIADDFIRDSELVESFSMKKRLPAAKLVEKYGHRLKTIERHRKYIITLIILKLHPEWQQLSQYIEIPLESEDKS